jgi:hypothetical protein
MIYIKDHGASFLPRNFMPTVEDLNDDLYSVKKAESVYESLAKK